MESGEIGVKQHHRNLQVIARSVNIKTWNNYRDDCDLCASFDQQTFSLQLEGRRGMIMLSICRKCGEVLASKIDAKIEFVAKKERQEKARHLGE